MSDKGNHSHDVEFEAQRGEGFYRQEKGTANFMSETSRALSLYINDTHRPRLDLLAREFSREVNEIVCHDVDETLRRLV